MPRDDSYLHTGMTSASTRSVAAKRTERQQEKGVQRTKLLPVAELINQLIAEEKKAICDITSLVLGTETLEENLKSDMIARKLNLAFINRFHGKINNLLRDPKGRSNE